MFRRIILTALLAGAGAGVFTWGLQFFTTTPLIVHAEQYENSDVPASTATDTDTVALQDNQDTGHSHDHDGETWAPHDGVERHAFTLLSSVLMGIGFGFILTAVFALHDTRVRIYEGILWGLAGFGAAYVAPALGLPPELPGMTAGDVTHRQVWWAATAMATAAGLGLMVYGRHMVMRMAGVVVTIIPHIVGAPHPEAFTMGLPAELVARFAVSSLVSVGLFWVVLGGLVAHFFGKFENA